MLNSLKSNKGYTMLEIIAIIAIMSLIAALAYPSLSNYVVQGKVADALQACGPIQSQVVDNIAKNETVTNSGVNVTVPTTVGRYTSSVTVSTNGVITINMNSSAGSAVMTLTPVYNSSSQQASWTCAVSNSSFNSLVPSSCRI